MRKTLPILFFLLQWCIVSLWSQGNYPIYVTTSLLPPYSLNLSDYSAQGSQRLMVTIVVKDLDVTNLPVKLRIRMETAGVTIETLPTINTIPIYLDGGSATVLFGEDFVDYFNINNLQFKGYSKESYRRSGLLPEGFYRFSVEVLHFQTNRVISNTSTATAWMAVGKPPVLRSPDNGVELGQFVGMPISFSWLASSVGSPVSAGSVRYKFELWEVRVQGVNPYNVAASMPAIHEHLTHTTLYAFNPASVMMEEGMTYAWRVTAFDESGRMPFEQNGQSEVRTFVYKSKCDKVNQIQTTTIGQKGTFDWTPAQNHTAYNVEVRNKANNWFLASQTFDSKVEFYNLEPGHTYELRTQSVCNGDPNTTSDFSDWVQLVMPEPKPAIINDDCPDCVCDDNIPKVEITNFDLRTNLISGDTLSNKSGTTRFIIKNVEQQGADTYRGVFYFWSELWKIKIPCDFWDLQVNTDNVIVSMECKSINNPAFLLDLDALSSTVNELLDYGAVIFSDAQIADTIQVVASFDNIHVRDGQLIAITLNPDGTVEETPLCITVEEAKKCLITNSNGDELVITSRGEVMGVKEYQQTGGGNNRLMNNYKKEKEANSLSTSAMVNFVAHPLQSFGFDKYTEQKQAIQHYYPALHNGYRPAFKSVGSFRTDRVGVDITEGLHFRDEMGIPSVLVDGGMSVNGAYHGSERALYAYRPTADGEEEIVGKLNVVSFDEEPRRVHIISVNNARLPSVNELEARLNSIYRQAVCTWTVIVQDPVTLTFPGGRMTHGGSGTASTYNSDQRAIATAFESSGRQMEPGSLYLFFVEDVTFKDRSLAGYMPLQRQVGFIYGNPSLEVVAHELAHGAFMMRHTFSPKAFIIGEGQTQNLMDYAGGTELWKPQWDLIHNPEKILFSWAQDEEEGAFSLYESFVTMEFEDVFSHFEENKRPKPWEYVYLDKTINQWGFYMEEFESSAEDYFSSIAVNSKYFTDQEEIDVFRQYYYYDFLFRSYTSYLISFVFNSIEINRKDADRLKKVFYVRAQELEEVSKTVVSQYTDVLLTKQKEERILAERKREYDRLKAFYQIEKENQALIRNYNNAMIGLTTVGVTVLTGGTGTVFWVTLVGGGVSFVGNTAQMFIRLSDNSQLKGKLKYIPTDYNDVVFCSITYFIGESQELQTANAVFDVVEGVIFLKLNPDIVSAANVVIQGVEVYQDIEISK